MPAEGLLPFGWLMAPSGKLPAPILHGPAYPKVGLASSMGESLGQFWPIELGYLGYSWVSDLIKMHHELNFLPRYIAQEIRVSSLAYSGFVVIYLI